MFTPARRRFVARASSVLAVISGAVVAVLAHAPAATAATQLTPGFAEQVVFGNLDVPTNIEFAPDGRIFVAEKSGVLKVFDDVNDTTPTVFADLSRNVHNLHDRGLLGLAIHPEFPVQPYVYVLYTYDAPPGVNAPYWNDNCDRVGGPTFGRCVVTGVLSRLQAAGNVMTGSEQVLIRDWCQQYPSHSIGDLKFGADGMLYATSGDGASYDFVDFGQTHNNPCGDPAGEGGALRSQDVRTAGDPAQLDGTVLRLDPLTGAAAAGNPNSASPDANARRIVAHGLRNPFRFAMRPGTTEVWLTDVGWNGWEEVNRVPTDSMGNYGWPCYEGNGRQDGYDGANLSSCENLYNGGGARSPFYTYSHDQQVVPGEQCATDFGTSSSGVAFYPSSGGTFPAEYRGAMFFADYTRQCIWAMMPTGPGGLPNASDRRTFASGAEYPVDLAVGPTGDLFYVAASGSVRRVRYFSGNQPPVAVIQASPTSGDAPLTVSFNGSGSTDADAGDRATLRYEWDFTGDGTVDSTAVAPTYTYPRGVHTARLTVRDTFGATGRTTVLVQAGNGAPTAFIDTPSTGTTWRVGETIRLSGRATDPQQGTLPASALRWQVNLHHCETLANCHVHPYTEFTGATGSILGPDHEYPSWVEVVLTVTDAQGLSHSASRRLEPRTVTLTFVSNPPGLQIAVGSAAQATPFTRTVIEGSTNSISGVTPQMYAGNKYVFVRWQGSGGPQTKVITANSSAVYSAMFARPCNARPPARC